MSSTLNDTVGAAKSTFESAKEGTQHAVSNARSTLLDGLRAVSGIVTIVKGLQLADPLAWIGLERRRGPFESLAIFGAGVAVGAGVGVLFAPTSGADLRRTIAARLKGLEKGAERVVEKAEAGVKEGVKDVEQKAEDLAGKAKDAAVGAEKKVEDLAGKAKDAAVGAEKKVEDFAGNLKDKAKSPADQRSTHVRYG